MLFIDSFFLFLLLPAALLCFYGARFARSTTVSLGVIVLVSAIFYAPYGPTPFLLLATSLAINLTVAMGMIRLPDERRRSRSALLTIGLLIDFGLLGLFKYTNDVAALAGVDHPLWRYAIPAGISFYTFHQAVFLVDAHARKPEVTAFLNQTGRISGKAGAAVRYAAFVAFFPQLVIGPIVYLSEFAPQILRKGFGRFSWVNLQVGITMIIFGLFKKVAIADTIARAINPVFDLAAHGDPITTVQALSVFPAFFFQIYFDFSGYSDMALGIARLFGIILPLNFDSPLRAIGIADFYRRWHITLTRVIARFLFTPLAVAGTRFAMEKGWKGWLRRAASGWLPMMLNFFVIALWHGAKETYLLFGLLHGLWYVTESEWKGSKVFKRLQPRTPEWVRTAAGQIICAILLMFTFALFRSESIEGFGHLLWRATHWSDQVKFPIYVHWWWLWACAAIVYLAPNVQEVLRRYRPGIVTYENLSRTPPMLRLRWRPNLLWGGAMAILLAIVIKKFGEPAPFLYGGF